MVLDDQGLAAMSAENWQDMLELLDDRYERKSTLITSQLPIDKWRRYLEDSTLVDATLDRIVHNSYKIELKGESMRKTQSKILMYVVLGSMKNQYALPPLMWWPD